MPAGPVAPQVSLALVLFAFLVLASILGAWVWAIIRLALGRPVVPRFAPRVVPWRGPAVLLVVAVWLAAQVVGPPIYLRLRGPAAPGAATEGESLRPGDLMIASAIENAGLLLALPLLLGLMARARPRDFLGEGAGGLRLVRAAQGMAAWPLIAPVVYGTMILAVWVWGRGTHPLERAIQAEGVGEHAWVFFLASVVLAPMAEELVFRGAILGWLTRLVLRRRAAQASVGPMGDGAIDEAPAGAIVLDDGGEADVSLDPAPWAGPEAPDEFAPPTASLGRPPALGPEGSGAGAPGAPVAWGDVAGRLLAANVLVSLLFAALHYPVWPTPVPIFFLSLVLGLLYQRTGSLVTPVVLHMTFNGVSTILMFLALGITPPAPAPASPGPGDPKPGASPAPAPAPIPVDDPAPVPAPLPKR